LPRNERWNLETNISPISGTTGLGKIKKNQNF
jgi:hypothetical protein